MNTDPSYAPAPEEESAAMLTAHALGQLEGRERDELIASLATPDAEAARTIVDETRRIAESLRADHAESLQSAAAPGRSQDLRRAIVATLAASPAALKVGQREEHGLPSVAPPTAHRRHRGPWSLLALAGSLAAAVLVGATVLLDGSPVRDVLPRAALPRAASPRINAMPGPAEMSEAGVAPSEEAQRRVAAKDSEKKKENGVRDHKTDSIAAANKRGVMPHSSSIARDEKSSELAPAAAAPAADALAGGVAAARTLAAPGYAIDGLARRPQEESTPGVSREGYERLEENRARKVVDEPLSTFSIDVDTASYANVRRFLSAGRLPPKDAVRIEELLNYFRYDSPQAEGDDPFCVVIESAASPWHEGRLLVRVGLRGRDIDRARRPAGNLVFLIDVSGSMQQPDKLPLVKQAVAMLVEELTENDRVSIVTYAGNAGLVLPPTTGDQKQRILAAIEGLVAGGSTHGSAGLELAYEQAAEHFIEGGVNRVILATDGDLNVGVTSDAALVELIKRKAAGGTFLTVLGFGQGNLQDAKMEKIADNGNGVYAYIDGVREARKVLVEQLTGSTITIAKDVKIQVEFNPATVASYRLIGYENRLLAARDFRDDSKDAGEIGAGHSVTALYEIVPVGGRPAGNAGSGAEPLKYQSQPEPAAAKAPVIDGPEGRELLTVKLRFKEPEGQASTLREFPLADRGGEFEAASDDLRFAAAVAAFGMILRGSDQAGSTTLDDVARIAGRAIGRDEGGYRAEFLDLVRKADGLDDGRHPSPRD